MCWVPLTCICTAGGKSLGARLLVDCGGKAFFQKKKKKKRTIALLEPRPLFLSNWLHLIGFFFALQSRIKKHLQQQVLKAQPAKKHFSFPRTQLVHEFSKRHCVGFFYLFKMKNHFYDSLICMRENGAPVQRIQAGVKKCCNVRMLFKLGAV